MGMAEATYCFNQKQGVLVFFSTIVFPWEKEVIASSNVVFSIRWIYCQNQVKVLSVNSRETPDLDHGLFYK